MENTGIGRKETVAISVLPWIANMEIDPLFKAGMITLIVLATIGSRMALDWKKNAQVPKP